VPQSYYFCIKNALKLTYDHLHFKKQFFLLAIARHERKGQQGKEGEGRGEKRRGRRQGRERKGREGEGKGKGKGKGKGQGATAPQIWNSVLAPG
jgi:hypothetical protein